MCGSARLSFRLSYGKGYSLLLVLGQPAHLEVIDIDDKAAASLEENHSMVLSFRAQRASSSTHSAARRQQPIWAA